MSIAENIAAVRERMDTAARRGGHSPEEITLMAVSKTFSSAHIRQAHEAGVRVFGENRVQEFAGKVEDVRSLTAAEWHLIGHLQSNKAGKAAELFNAVDSIDSLRLAEKLNAAAGKLGTRLKILIEVNVGGEAVKSGVSPGSSDLEELLQAAPQLGQLDFRGLMTIPPFTQNAGDARPYFRQLRKLRDDIAARHLPGIDMAVLSMGMSHDFEVAIEEGSTCVRLGTAIFGARN